MFAVDAQTAVSLAQATLAGTAPEGGGGALRGSCWPAQDPFALGEKHLGGYVGQYRRGGQLQGGGNVKGGKGNDCCP